MNENISSFKTPLYQDHVQMGARMVDFQGWQMPVQYEGIISEYFACRHQCAVFDISHMGELIVKGHWHESGLDHLLTCSLSDLEIGNCRYGMMITEEGGVIDDLIIFRLKDREYLLVVNAGNIEKDFLHLQKYLSDPKAVEDRSLKIGKIDIQGPLSREALSIVIAGIERLEYYRFDYFTLEGEELIISRTGYTGELGYEIFIPWNKTKILWQKLLENDKVKVAGLGARDLLRMEMGYSLYGHEIDETVSPLEAGLSRFIDFGKDFMGKQALMQQEKHKKIRHPICFLSENRRSPRQGQMIFSEHQAEIGQVTSGTFSPSLQKGIGMALVSRQQDFQDKKIFFGEHDQKTPATIIQKPFYKNGSLRK